MNYGRLILDAAQLAWRHRFLWFFGVFAGALGPSCSQFNFSGNFPSGGTGDPGAGPGSGQLPFVDFALWVQDNLGLIIALFCLILLVILGFFILGIISQGALIGAVARIEGGEPTGFGAAWRAGLATFWRLLGLNLLEVAASLVVALLFVPALAFAAAAVLTDSGARILFIVLAILAALVALFLALIAWIILGVIFIYARLAAGAEARRVFESVRAGYTLLRQQPGKTALVWLIHLGVSIGIAIAVVLISLVIGIPIALIAIALFLTMGVSAIPILFVALAAVVVLALFLVVAGVTNTYHWSYWTLGFLRLRRLTDGLAPPAPAPAV
jgi:hypothetical protein